MQPGKQSLMHSNGYVMETAFYLAISLSTGWWHTLFISSLSYRVQHAMSSVLACGVCSAQSFVWIKSRQCCWLHSCRWFGGIFGSYADQRLADISLHTPVRSCSSCMAVQNFYIVCCCSVGIILQVGWEAHAVMLCIQRNVQPEVLHASKRHQHNGEFILTHVHMCCAACGRS